MTQALSDLSVLAGRPEDRKPAADDPEVPRTGVDVPMPKTRWKTRVLLPGAILCTTAVTLLMTAGRALWPAMPVRVAPVVLKTGVQAAGKVIVQAPGWVEADPFPTAVTALADGVVAEVLVLEGQPVEPNQVVARLIADEARLALAKAESALHAAAAEVAAAQAELKAAQREWDNPIELTRKLATAQAELAERQAELARWPAELQAEIALAEYKQAEYLRVKPLHGSGSVSNIEVIRAEKEYENQRALAEAVRNKKPILEAQIASLEAEVTAARENLRLRIGETRRLEAAQAHLERVQAARLVAEVARDEAALRLERMEVRAPVGGIVMNRLVEPGSKLMLGGTEMDSALVMRLYDPQKLQVRVDVPLTDAGRVGVGQRAEVVVDVLPDRVFQGRITRIVNEADIQKNTLQVKVAIADPAPEIKPEMLARARFFSDPETATDSPGQRLFVPQSAVIRHTGGHTMLWVADQARNVALPRTVTVAPTTADGWVEIESGVQPGDRVIVDPPQDLEEGARIRITGEIAGDSFSPAKGIGHGAH